MGYRAPLGPVLEQFSASLGGPIAAPRPCNSHTVGILENAPKGPGRCPGRRPAQHEAAGGTGGRARAQEAPARSFSRAPPSSLSLSENNKHPVMRVFKT